MTNDGFSPDPWRACYAQLAPKLLLFARQWVGSQADAEDVVQTAFIRFWRQQPEAQPEHYPLLYAAVRTVALDLLRTNGRRGMREEKYSAEEASLQCMAFDPLPEQAEMAEMVQLALDAIPPQQRETLVLRIWGELTFAEIAATVGESINTVASRYRYAMEAMRKVIKPQYERL
jgi:RNA polymerase sigma-70 factor, ECF subfamily